jgi:hypothetical protein
MLATLHRATGHMKTVYKGSTIKEAALLKRLAATLRCAVTMSGSAILRISSNIEG